MCEKTACNDVIECESCHQWFHFTCVGIREEEGRDWNDAEWACMQGCGAGAGAGTFRPEPEPFERFARRRSRSRQKRAAPTPTEM